MLAVVAMNATFGQLLHRGESVAVDLVVRLHFVLVVPILPRELDPKLPRDQVVGMKSSASPKYYAKLCAFGKRCVGIFGDAHGVKSKFAPSLAFFSEPDANVISLERLCPL